jgi:RimJ/RimL family protein N-acetyltransferase
VNDLAEISDIYADRENMRWFGAGSTFSPLQIADSLVNVIAEYAGGLGNYAVIEKDTAKIVGHCGLHRGLEPDIEVEIDCLIVRDRWVLGYGTEASIAVARHGFLQKSFAAISAVAHHENQAAIALCKKLGMSYFGRRLRFGFSSVVYQVSAEVFFEKFTTGRR